MMRYAIKLVDQKGTEYLLLEEEGTEYQVFDSYEEADDFNYDFEQTLEDGLTSVVVEFN